jgi:hypothetical protein
VYSSSKGIKWWCLNFEDNNGLSIEK